MTLFRLAVTFLFLLITSKAVGDDNLFLLAPQKVTLDPQARNRNIYFSLSNNDSVKKAIQLEMYKTEMDEQGRETLTVDEENFIIFPAQVIMGPGERRTIKVSWLGGQEQVGELLYRLIAEQVPLQFNKSKRKGSSLSVLLRYEASVYIAPKKSTALLGLKGFQHHPSKKELWLWVENSGNRHATIDNLHIKIDDIEFPPLKEANGIRGENVLAGKVRLFKIPLKARKKKIEKVTVQFDNS